MRFIEKISISFKILNQNNVFPSKYLSGISFIFPHLFPHLIINFHLSHFMITFHHPKAILLLTVRFFQMSYQIFSILFYNQILLLHLNITIKQIVVSIVFLKNHFFLKYTVNQFLFIIPVHFPY